MYGLNEQCGLFVSTADHQPEAGARKMLNKRITATWFGIVAVLQTCGGLDIDVSGCGNSKSCLQKPKKCEATSCDFLLTWRPIGNDSVIFEMSASIESPSSYVAFGLSHDVNMVTHSNLFSFPRF